MDLLLNGVGYLKFTFSDLSEKVIRTTLNPNILAKYGVSAKEHHIFCIDTGTFVPIREDAIDVMVSKEPPEFNNEVNEFASRFI